MSCKQNSRAATTSVLVTTVIVNFFLSTSDALDDPVSNVCPQINKYLQSSYGCRPSEFRRSVACGENRIEIRCPRSTHIAIHSASYGWSDRLIGSSCPLAPAHERGCPRTCILQKVQQLCQSKRRCLLEADDDLVPQSIRCPAGSIKYLGVIHTCVKKSSLRHIESSDTIFVNPCDEEDDDNAEPVRPHPPFLAFPTTVTSAIRSGWIQTESSSNGEEQSQQGHALRNVNADTVQVQSEEPQNFQTTMFGWYQRPSSTHGRSLREGFVRNRSEGNGWIPLHTVTPGVQMNHIVTPAEKPSIWMQSFMDWVWTWNYVNENTEKFVLYLLLGLSLGTIAILVAILCHMIFCHRRSPSKEAPSSGIAQQGTIASCSSPTWRMPESESSTGDDRTLHDDDVELTSFNHIDSLQRHANYHQSGCRPPSYSSRPQSPTVTTTATISRTYSQANPVVTRCFTPSPPAITLPECSVPNGGFLPPTSQLSNGRVEVTPLSQPNCVGSLGRTYSNHYRRDSYQLDPAPGCRTLQPMQHYYG